LRPWGLRHVANRVYDAIARNRTAVSTYLGLNACGTTPPPSRVPPPEPPSPLEAAGRRVLAVLREGTLALVMVAAAGQVVVESEWLRRQTDYQQPGVLRAIIDLPRLRQGWHMFAPEAPHQDATVVIDALTADGRRVDPLAWAARGTDVVFLDAIPSHLGLDELWCNYIGRIRSQPGFHDALRRWIARHAERVARPGDRIVAYRVLELRHDSPPPGQWQGTGLVIDSFLHSDERAAPPPRPATRTRLVR
jgi:hypothetical protein